MEKDELFSQVFPRDGIDFRFQGAAFWMRGLSILLKEPAEMFKYYQCKNLNKNLQNNAIIPICQNQMMSLDYLQALKVLSESEGNTKRVLRLAVIAWYYSIYFSSKAMNIAASNQHSENHKKNADCWYNLLVKPGYIIAPFSYHVDTLIKTDVEKLIPQKGDSSKPITQDDAERKCLTYLKGSSVYLREIEEKKIKTSHNIDKFLKKIDKETRDNALGKKYCSFLHQAIRFRGKGNYRDADYLIFYDKESIINEFTKDMEEVARTFLLMSMFFSQEKVKCSFYTDYLNKLSTEYSAIQIITPYIKDRS